MKVCILRSKENPRVTGAWGERLRMAKKEFRAGGWGLMCQMAQGPVDSFYRTWGLSRSVGRPCRVSARDS